MLNRCKFWGQNTRKRRKNKRKQRKPQDKKDRRKKFEKVVDNAGI
jgi:hypothetical protein